MNTIGLIGCGSIAEHQYTGIIKSYFGNYKKLFYDTNGMAALGFAKNMNGESCSLNQLIKQSDFIIITTPPDSHYELLMSSIHAGKTILCEKPFLLDVKHVLEIIELADNVGANVYAAHLRRFFPGVIAAKEFIETGLLGKLLKVEIYEGGRFNWESLVERTRTPEKEPSHVFKATFRIEGSDINVDGNIYLSRRTALANKLNIYFEKGLIEVPLDLKNAVKISTRDGKTILDEKYPVKSFEEAFQEQFRHIIEDKGYLLSARRFVNTTKLLQTLITG
jgi:hypothetical protein